MITLRDVLTILSVLISSGFIYGGVKFILRHRAEAGAIIIKSAEGVVVLQATIIKELRDENTTLKKEIELLKAKVEELTTHMESCESRIRDIYPDKKG